MTADRSQWLMQALAAAGLAERRGVDQERDEAVYLDAARGAYSTPCSELGCDFRIGVPVDVVRDAAAGGARITLSCRRPGCAGHAPLLAERYAEAVVR